MTGIIDGIGQHIAGKVEKGEPLDEHQKLFLVLIEQYGNADIGLLFTFFLNIIKCSKGEAFVCSPDEPHAYIQGELMEAMVNSDNVVRGGLTPKYKDTKTLVEVSNRDISKFNGKREKNSDSKSSINGSVNFLFNLRLLENFTNWTKIDENLDNFNEVNISRRQFLLIQSQLFLTIRFGVTLINGLFYNNNRCSNTSSRKSNQHRVCATPPTTSQCSSLATQLAIRTS